MSFNYNIADFVSRINVASSKHLVSVKVRRNEMSFALLKIFLTNGIISGFKIDTTGNGIIVLLKYRNYKRIPSSISIISRPGKRIFWKLSSLNINYNKTNFGGFYIISTSKGLFTSTDCLLGLGISGEVLLKVVV